MLFTGESLLLWGIVVEMVLHASECLQRRVSVVAVVVAWLVPFVVYCWWWSACMCECITYVPLPSLCVLVRPDGHQGKLSQNSQELPAPSLHYRYMPFLHT